jgi:molecular chaperone HscB
VTSSPSAQRKLDSAALAAAAEARAAEANIVACWSCRGPIPAGGLFCPSCEAVQPPGQHDHFRRIGLPASFDVDKAELDRRYFDLQRQLHPDRFATKSAKERALSQQQATSLNEAYETLQDPLNRAVYLLHLKGVDVLAEGCNQINDPVILMEAMELREVLAATESVAQVNLFAANTQADIDECITDLATAFRKGALDEAGSLTTRLKYLRKLIEETRVHKARLASRS